MRLDGVIADAAVLIDEAMNAATFTACAQQYLAPSLRRGDVVVMDNLSWRKSEGVRALVESADATLWLLPPYSLDFNLIAKWWSKVKSWLRRVEARTFEASGAALVEVLWTVSPQEYTNDLRSGGHGNCCG